MMNGRIIYRGEESIRWLGSQGITFTKPLGRSKKAMPTGWNLPGAGVDADEATAHYRQRKNVGALTEHVTIIDIDFDFPEKVATLGSLAHTAKIWRNNANERGALLYRVTDGPVQSANWKPEGATEPHAELLAQTKTGNFKQKNVAGYHNDGEYFIVDAQHGIREITRADLTLIWLLITGEELHAPKPLESHIAKPAERKPVKEDDLVAQVKAHWPTLAVFEHFGFVKNGIERERNGSVRILGWGGLIVQRDGLWYNHSEHVGGDAIDAWAYCIKRDRDRYFVEIIEEMGRAAGIEVQRFPTPAPLPAEAVVLDSGTIVLKTTPTPEPKPRPQLPACTPDLCAALQQSLNSPEGRALLHAFKNREVYVAALAVLLAHAPRLGGWKFDIKTRDLGVLLNKTHMSASRNLHALDRVGLVNYRHGVTQMEASDAPSMSVDLSPIASQLLGVTGLNDAQDVTEFTLPTSCNVWAHYASDGQFADATMRANPMTKGLHGRTLRSLSASALNGLDLVARGELAITRRMLVDELGMSPGSAAGATRVYTELGIATVEKVGRSNEYVFSPDWRAQLDALVPKMVSFLALYRLKIRNLSDRIVEVERHIRRLGGDPKHVREEDSQPIRDLHTRRKKMIFARKCLIEDMEAKDMAHRPETSPAPQPGQWVGTPRHRAAQPARKRPAATRVSEGDLIERRLALYAMAREMAVAA